METKEEKPVLSSLSVFALRVELMCWQLLILKWGAAEVRNFSRLCPRHCVPPCCITRCLQCEDQISKCAITQFQGTCTAYRRWELTAEYVREVRVPGLGTVPKEQPKQWQMCISWAEQTFEKPITSVTPRMHFLLPNNAQRRVMASTLFNSQDWCSYFNVH